MNNPHNDPYLDCERTLERLVGNPPKSPYFQAATAIEHILKDENLSPDQKAQKLADIMKRGITST